MRLLMILLVGTVAAAGCRHRPAAPVNVRVSMDVNIQEAAPPPPSYKPAPGAKKEQKKAPKSRVTPIKNKPKAAPAAEKSKHRDSGPFKPLVPSAVGAFDDELNSVEQSYINDIRRKREKAARESEAKIFGSYSPGALFKQPQSPKSK